MEKKQGYVLAPIVNSGVVFIFFMHMLFILQQNGYEVGNFKAMCDFLKKDSEGLMLFGSVLLGFLFFSVINFHMFYLNIKNKSNENNINYFLTNVVCLSATVLFAIVIVPGVFSIVEYLLVGLMALYFYLGFKILKQMAIFLSDLILNGSSENENKNIVNLNTASMGLSVVALGLSLMSLMSNLVIINLFGVMGSFFFVLSALVSLFLFTLISFSGSLNKKNSEEMFFHLAINVPTVTFSTISVYYMLMTMKDNFFVNISNVFIFLMFFGVFMFEVLMLILIFNMNLKVGNIRKIRDNEESADVFYFIAPFVGILASFNFLMYKGMTPLTGYAMIEPVVPIMVAAQFSVLFYYIKIINKFFLKKEKPVV